MLTAESYPLTAESYPLTADSYYYRIAHWQDRNKLTSATSFSKLALVSGFKVEA